MNERMISWSSLSLFVPINYYYYAATPNEPKAYLAMAPTIERQ